MRPPANEAGLLSVRHDIGFDSSLSVAVSPGSLIRNQPVRRSSELKNYFSLDR
jgi:hypothetical protein